MSLVLRIEHGPRSQAVTQARLDSGELVIGRSADAGWQIDDPDMFISRAHARIVSEGDGYFITDTSSSGLFVDDAASPLGPGKKARLANGMRLRLGDYTVAVEIERADFRPPAFPAAAPPPPPSFAQPSFAQPSFAQPPPAPVSRGPLSLGGDDFFSSSVPEEPKRPRPVDLPNPFEQPVQGAFSRAKSDERNSLAFDDPFSLDPVATPHANAPDQGSRNGAAFDDPFGLGPVAKPAPAPDFAPAAKSAGFDDDFSFGPAPVPAPSVEARAEPKPAPFVDPKPAAAPWDLPMADPSPPAPERPVQRQPPPPPAPRPVPQAKAPFPPKAAPQLPRAEVDQSELRAAFLRGIGIEDAGFSTRDPVAEMEKFGREYRLMLEGLMQLLRKRAEEKGNARVAQTVVGASEVNPLKFLPTADDVLATIMADRSPGFLSGEPAIKDAVRDLAQHHVRAWRGVQGALRSMIDRFDPAAIEEELKSSSAIGTLLSGGRGAKLWELYQKRHRDIAQSAETRFWARSARISEMHMRRSEP